LSAKIDEKLSEMKSDLDSINSAFESEKTTYLAFQKIKDRVVTSIDSYGQQLKTIEKEIDRITKEASADKEILKQDAIAVQDSLRSSAAGDILKAINTVDEKKKLIDEIRTGIEELSSTIDNLNKRITLLSNEAKLLEIRAPSEATSPVVESKKKEIRESLTLSEDEELEFRKKREELRSLIKKLWE
ncbi:hypothetical protein HZC07_00405, partial [Candidatus Micrarchaeota archaeon]|nr:hypothetical protein [Candidatus Micrarchaeota archaeon]